MELLERPDDRLVQVRCGVQRFVKWHLRTRGAVQCETELDDLRPNEDLTTVVVEQPASASAV
jgi:hypothetical protein